MKRVSIYAATILVVLQLCGSLNALPTTAYDAEIVVKGWLKVNPQPLGSDLGKKIMSVEIFTDEYGEPIYYVVYLQPSGYVIVSSDDLVEPIIAFVADGTYDSTHGNPLEALVTKDLKRRTTAVRSSSVSRAIIPQVAISETRNKWSYLMGLASVSEDGYKVMSIDPICDANLSDLRVPPLVDSKWGQSNYYDSNDQPLACYNYFTPQYAMNRISFDEGNKDNYPCGCVAVALAQFLRYQRYPQEPVEYKEFRIVVDGRETNRGLLLGDGPGGAYDWDGMVAVPSDETTDRQRRTIGAICHDAAIAIETEFTAHGSGASLDYVADALLETFKYKNAMWAEGEGIHVSRQYFLSIFNCNLDAGIPVILGFRNSDYPWIGHAGICDGYGYNMSVLYHHLNMGWEGQHDCWYSLPDIACPDLIPFDAITQCVYNIFTDCTGEIVSGRIIDENGMPFENITVTARSDTDTDIHATVTNDNGIYAFVGLDSGTLYTITPDKLGYDFDLNVGYGPELNNVLTGQSNRESYDTGNRWGINFIGYSKSDPNSNDQKSQVVCTDVKLTASDGEREDHFGCSVAMSGDYAIVGAYGNDSNRGAAYIFKHEGSNWIEQVKLMKPWPRHSDDYFGNSVSINGDYAVVGSGNNKDFEGTSFGAFVFKRNGTAWSLQNELRSLNMESGDFFGSSVSISGDYVIVGSPHDHSDTEKYDYLYFGSVNIFEWNGINWTEQVKLFASDGSEHSYFGYLVSISGDYAITTTGFNTKSDNANGFSVYILKRDGTSWMEQTKLNSPNVMMRDAFGRSISISEKYAVIGAPEENNENGEGSGSVFIFEREGTNWTQQSRLIALGGDSVDHFGRSVCLNGDLIIVGSPDDDDHYGGRNSGSAYVFEHDGESWIQRSKLTAMDSAYDDFLGTSVAISEDYALVGAPKDDDKGQDSGSVYVFKRIGTIWTP